MVGALQREALVLWVLALAVLKTGLELGRPVFGFDTKATDKALAAADVYWPPRSLAD